MYKRRTIIESTERISTHGFCADDRKAELIGDKIIKAAKFGADLGLTCAPLYDENADPESKDFDRGVDIVCDPNADFFDIAERFGEMVEQSAPPQTNE